MSGLFLLPVTAVPAPGPSSSSAPSSSSSSTVSSAAVSLHSRNQLASAAPDVAVSQHANPESTPTVDQALRFSYGFNATLSGERASSTAALERPTAARISFALFNEAADGARARQGATALLSHFTQFLLDDVVRQGKGEEPLRNANLATPLLDLSNIYGSTPAAIKVMPLASWAWFLIASNNKRHLLLVFSLNT